MKLLITGCAGFIGVNFTKYWLENHAEDIIVGVDCLTYAANLSELKNLQKNASFIFYKMNICDREAIYRIFQIEKPDTVVNFAAESHVDNSIVAPESFLKTNILGTATLMDACLKYDVARYHQVSTDEVYGDLPLESTERFLETSPLRPSSPYSGSKASADLLVQAYYRTYALPVTISRSSNNYGPYQYPEKLIPLTITNILQNKAIPIYGQGINVRDWLYVEDHCKAIDLIIHKDKIGEIYNIGANNEQKNIDVVKRICQELGQGENLITYVADRKGHDLRYAIDATKIRQELGWIPETSFSEGIKRTVAWYLNSMTN